MFWKKQRRRRRRRREDHSISFGRITLLIAMPSHHHLLLAPLWIPLVIWFSFIFYLLIQQSHYRVWTCSFTSWPLCSSMGGSLPHALGSELGSGCVCNIRHAALPHWSTLVCRRQVYPNVACTSPTSNWFVRQLMSRDLRKRWQVIDSWLFRSSIQQELHLDLSVIWPPSQQLWTSRKVK